MIRHTWTQEEIRAALPWLKRENALGADIFMRPADARFILVDDIAPTTIDKLKRGGLPPSAVVGTEPGKFQAWVRLTDDPIPQDIADTISRRIAEATSANPKAANHRCLGRLAGFTNRNPNLQRGTHYPYILIHDHQPLTAPKGPLLVDMHRPKAAQQSNPDGNAKDRTPLAAPAPLKPDWTRVAVEQHLAALPAVSYAIAVKSTKDGQPQMDQFQGTRVKIITSLPWLNEQAEQGAKITMRPLNSRYVLAHNLNERKRRKSTKTCHHLCEEWDGSMPPTIG